jgi:hypothetical protein
MICKTIVVGTSTFQHSRLGNVALDRIIPKVEAIFVQGWEVLLTAIPSVLFFRSAVVDLQEIDLLTQLISAFCVCRRSSRSCSSDRQLSIFERLICQHS